MPAYLDHAASTPVRPEAVEAMLPWLVEHPGNPSGAHGAARLARKAIDEARDVVAAALGAEPNEVVFTSGGTEADNLAVLGVLDRRGGVAVCSAVEHHAVLDPVLARGGRTVPVTKAGVVDLGALAAALDEEAAAGRAVALVSVMLANNEVGVVQPVDVVVDTVRAHAPGALVHTDAVQALAWLDVGRRAAGADLVSVSAHKLGGPKGVGALVVRDPGAVAARAIGGGQERALRGGTQNVAGIAGFGAAVAVAEAERDRLVARVGALRDRLERELVGAVAGLVPTLPEGTERIAGTCHVCIDDIESEALLFLLDRDDIAASAAASCSSGALEPSHVLAAMGIDRSRAVGSLRLSLGWSSTDADVDTAVRAVAGAVERLRSAP